MEGLILTYNNPINVSDLNASFTKADLLDQHCLIQKYKEGSDYSLDYHCLREEGVRVIQDSWHKFAICLIIVHLLRFMIWKILDYFSTPYTKLLLRISNILGYVADGLSILLALFILYFALV